MVKKILSYSYVYLILILMYLPIFYLIASSFTNTEMVGQWNGFSFNLYYRLFHNEEVLIAIGNTLILAVIAASVSTLLGSLGATGLFYSKKSVRRVFEGINQIPVVNAEIVMAISLTVTFVFIGKNIFNGTDLKSFWTLLIGHCLIATPFVYLNVKPRLIQMDPSMYEAGLDLGYTPLKALHRIIYPEILPGIVAGFSLSFSLSLDDFIITFFTRGSGLLSGENTIETVSTLVEEKIKKGDVPPEMRAYTTILFVIAVSVILIRSIYAGVKSRKNIVNNKHSKRREALKR